MTAQYPLVSVIIPVYNMAEFIGETLDSVLASTYPAIEVVVMDDGSKDNSMAIVQEYAACDARVKPYSQPNAGACAARNHAISLAQGHYILPVDSDDKIAPQFIAEAVKVLEQDPEVKVVYSRAEFFGDRTGEWKLQDFDINLLARKNFIPITAVYRKIEWERAGGYCEEIIAREDWEFWISVLKNGGKVVKLPQVLLFYRFRQNSKRVSDRKLKHHVIDTLNKRHPEFFERYLGGPLRYNRSWSWVINRLTRWFR